MTGYPGTDPLRAQQARTLRRYKTVPVLLLVAMAAGYLVALRMPVSGFQGYLMAFCEAAMVGALADWFAVTALFRRPLGLPIPHTAIIQTRKNALGEALAGFVQRHFLTRETIARRAARVDFSQAGADWLARQENADRLAAQLLAALHGMLQLVDERPLREFLRREVDTAAVARMAAPMVARLLSGLYRSGHHQPLLTELVVAARNLLANNHDLLLGQAGQGSPWWLPRSVDRRLFAALLARVDELLVGVAEDASHPLRDEIDHGMLRLTSALEAGDEQAVERLQAALEGCLDDTALHDVLMSLWQAARDYVLDGSADAQRGPWQKRLSGYLMALAGRLQDSPALRELLNRWIRMMLEAGVSDHGHELGRLISETVASWNPRETARLIELEVGKDLQFIRINGTLVGGLIGILIHAVGNWLAPASVVP